MRRVLAIALLLGILPTARAQEINFGNFYTGAAIALTVIRDLDFGTIVAGETKERAIGSGLEGVLELEGIPYLDVVVTITNPGYVYLNGDGLCVLASCRIPVTLTTAFTNNGELVDQVGTAITFTGGTVRFPIRRRVSGPPMPPPDPFLSTQLPSYPSASAFIYIGAQLVSSVSANAGDYSSVITVEVQYF